MAQLVSEAREAAEEMVQGSGAEAAAIAAERALRSGGVWGSADLDKGLI